MNERIKELAEQARKKPMGDSWCYTNPQEFEKKFAELIVRECAEKCVYVVDRQEILAHFGVEE